MKTCVFTLTLAMCLMAMPFASAEPTTFDEVLEAISESAASVETWSSDATIEMLMGGMAISYTAQMKGKGTMSSVEMDMDMFGQKMSMKTYLGADGIQWMDMDMMGERQIMKLDMNRLAEMGEEMTGLSLSDLGGGSFGMPEDPTKMLESYKELYDMVYENKEMLGDTEVYVVKGTMKEDAMGLMDPTGMMKQMGMSMETSMLYVGVEDGFMRKMVILGADDEPFMTMEMTNVVLNTPMDDSEFAYTPPDDAVVMDMTEMLDGGFEGLTDGEDVEEIDEVSFNVESAGKYRAGDVAPAFEAAALSGETIKLSDYEGKVVLIDFWATWCGPCVSEVPAVIDAYENYHAQGLEIIGVSFDDDQEALDNFLASRDGMSWAQIFDGLGWESRVGNLYGVEAIPHTLLLDREGTVYAVDLRGDELSVAIGDLLQTTD